MEQRTDGPKKNRPASEKLGLGIAMGIAIGTALGAAMDNMGAGIAIGVAIGAGIGTTWSRRPPDEQDTPRPPR
jgi:uncharacterized membrane protein